jgi:ABC-type uncharacterized transport system permease subunit
MIAIATGISAVFFYALSTLLQGQSLIRGVDKHRNVLQCAVLALLLHLLNVIQVIATDTGLDFGFFKIVTLFSWTIAITVVVSSLKKPLANLFLALFPLAIISIVCSLWLPSGYIPQPNPGGGVLLHIMLGIMSFALITIAAVQALLIAWLNRELKHKHFSAVLQHLPPLQTMEVLLFEIIFVGFVLLLAVITSGFLFMDNMFAQHLVHKTVLTVVSTSVFGVLLWGRHQLGWRGNTALRWTLSGFAVLILAYFGSKFVLELILNRV